MTWLKTRIEGVEVQWVEDRREAKVSRYYPVSESGEPLTEADYDDVQLAVEEALEATGIPVCLDDLDGGDAGEGVRKGVDGEPDEVEEILFFAAREDWKPTHKITALVDGETVPTVFFVKLYEDYEGEGGPAYDRVEWRSENNASWTYDPEEGWRCEGQVLPGGANGVVEVETL